MKLKNNHLSKQEIKLDKGQVNVLGPNLILVECDVISHSTNDELIVAGLTMRGGSFIQKLTLSNFHFKHTHFSNVNFDGNYVGCDFGGWDSVDNASIESCDFSGANLDGCRFLNCDAEALKFPIWPCFVIFNPTASLSFVSSRKWPGKIGMLLQIYTDSDPECTAVCGDAGRIAAKNGIALQDFRSLLESIPGISIFE